jgi:hypothetical protein
MFKIPFIRHHPYKEPNKGWGKRLWNWMMPDKWDFEHTYRQPAWDRQEGYVFHGRATNYPLTRTWYD